MKTIFFNHAVVLLGFLVFSTSLAYGQRTQGELQVTPDTLDFGEVQAYSTVTATAPIVFSNCGVNGSALCWQVESSDNWIRRDSMGYQGVIDLPDDVRFVNYTMGACGLCVAFDKEDYEEITGVYEGSFSIAQYFYDESDEEEPCQWDSAAIDRVTIKATMTISEYNILEVDKEELDFGEDGGDGTIVITNAGEGTMEWEAVVSADTVWLTINDGTGASGTTISGDTDTLTVRVDRSMVEEGCAYEYLAFIKITSANAAPEEVVVYVTMNKAIETPQPSSPTPTDGSTDHSLYSSLKWQEGASGGDVGGIVYFDVYFSTSQELVESESPSVLVCDELEVPYCDPSKGSGLLDANTTYYWKVKAVDECEEGTPSYGGPWSFTIGSAAVEPTCPVSLLLSLNDSEVTLLRRFRDEVMVRSLAGERYVDLYYSPQAIEALLILLFNPELRMCADKIVKESLPAIQSLLRGETALIDSEIRAEIELFLEEFGKDASPGLKRIINIIKKDIATEDVFSGLGLFVVQ